MASDRYTRGSVPSVSVCVGWWSDTGVMGWSLWVVDGHGLHGIGQVLVPSSLLLLLPSILLFLCFLRHLLIDRSGLDELNDLCQTWRWKKNTFNPSNKQMSKTIKKHDTEGLPYKTKKTSQKTEQRKHHSWTVTALKGMLQYRGGAPACRKFSSCKAASLAVHWSLSVVEMSTHYSSLTKVNIASLQFPALRTDWV